MFKQHLMTASEIKELLQVVTFQVQWYLKAEIVE